MAYIYDLSDQWAAAGTTFTAIKMNVADTASAAGSLLMDLQVGGVSRFNVAKDGAVFLPILDNALIRNSSAYYPAVSLNAGSSNVGGVSLYAGNTGFSPGSAIYLSVYSGYDGNLDGTRIFNGIGFATRFNRTTLNAPDTIILRDAANTLAQRNGVNAQAFNLYNTYTDASNYERGFMRFVSNVLQIGSDKLGTGTARSLVFQTDGTTRMTIGAASGVTFNSQVIDNGNFRVTGTGNQMVVGGSFGVSEGGDQGPIIYSGGHLGWFSGTISTTAQVPDLRLYRDAADNLAQRRGTNAQTSRLYGTYTDASNYRRLTNTMSTAGVAEIKPEGAGTGASGNVLHISGLPTSNPGPGILWNNAGTPAIGT